MARRKGDEHAENILRALGEAKRPLSAYDLLAELRPTGVAAPLTIYRALDKLLAAGKVHRIASLNAFVACRDAQDHIEGHGHGDAHAVGFAICDGCGSVDEFVPSGLRDCLRAELASRSFAALSSTIEVHGLCGPCHAKA